MTSTIRRATLDLIFGTGIVLVGLILVVGGLVIVAESNDAHAQPAPHHALVGAVPPAPMSTLQPVPGPVEVAPVVTPPSAPAAPDPMPWSAWLLIALAALGGVERILAGIRALLGVIAPRTKTTADDNVRDFVAKLDDQALAILRALLGMAPTAPPETVSTTAPTAPSPTRVANLSALLALVVAGSAIVMQPGCAARQRTAAGVKASLDCEAPNLAVAALDGLALATQAILSTISGSGHPDSAALKAALGAIKGDGLRCAASGVIAALLTPPEKRTDAPAAAGLEVDTGELRAAFAAVRAEWGVESVRVSGQIL